MSLSIHMPAPTISQNSDGEICSVVSLAQRKNISQSYSSAASPILSSLSVCYDSGLLLLESLILVFYMRQLRIGWYPHRISNPHLFKGLTWMYVVVLGIGMLYGSWFWDSRQEVSNKHVLSEKDESWSRCMPMRRSMASIIEFFSGDAGRYMLFHYRVDEQWHWKGRCPLDNPLFCLVF